MDLNLFAKPMPGHNRGGSKHGTAYIPLVPGFMEWSCSLLAGQCQATTEAAAAAAAARGGQGGQGSEALLAGGRWRERVRCCVCIVSGPTRLPGCRSLSCELELGAQVGTWLASCDDLSRLLICIRLRICTLPGRQSLSCFKSLSWEHR